MDSTQNIIELANAINGSIAKARVEGFRAGQESFRLRVAARFSEEIVDPAYWVGRIMTMPILEESEGTGSGRPVA